MCCTIARGAVGLRSARLQHFGQRPCCRLAVVAPSWTKGYRATVDAAPPDLLGTLAHQVRDQPVFPTAREGVLNLSPQKVLWVFFFSFLFALQDAQGIKLCQSWIYKKQGGGGGEEKFCSLYSFWQRLFSWLCWILVSMLLEQKEVSLKIM